MYRHAIQGSFLWRFTLNSDFVKPVKLRSLLAPYCISHQPFLSDSPPLNSDFCSVNLKFLKDLFPLSSFGLESS